MKNYNRELLVMYKDDVFDESLLHHQVETLNRILVHAEKFDVFCQAHELVNRHRITQNESAILRAIQEPTFKPFQFLLNKN